MESKTKTLIASNRPDSLAAMLHNKSETSGFSNSARDTIKPTVNNTNYKECENLVLESSDVINLFQRVEIPALQTPLTTTGNVYALLPFVTLPRELVEQIVLLLDTESIIMCRLVNKRFNEIIRSSVRLQYFLACKAAGVIDNPRSPLSYVERLEALKKREDAWRKLKPVFDMTISVKFRTSSRICRSTEGVFILTDNNLKDLNYCHLTSLPQNNPQWIRIPGHGPARDWSGILVNFATALYEHDLIVNFTSSYIENQHSLDLVLLKFSTGDYHPLARYPRINVQRSPEVKPWVVSRIVGDNLVLVVHSLDGTFSDKLFVFDWKTGRKLLQHDASKNPYLDFVFVSPELFLVPNCVLSNFEVWHLPPQQPNPKPPIQILSLQIPAVSPGYSILEFRCYGEPNPFIHSVPYLPPRPFFSSPENSIIMATLRLSSNSGRRASFNLIMHRRALLDMLQIHQAANPGNGSVELDARSKLTSTMLHPSSSSRIPTFYTSHISAGSGSSPVSSGLSAESPTSQQCTFLQVPWANWGPPVSRWFQVNGFYARWLFRFNGQRCAFLGPNPLDSRKSMISVIDFNPHNFRRKPEMMESGEGENNGSNNKGKENEEQGFEILDHKSVFSEAVYMGLKCVVYCAPDEYDFDLVWMDEERLLGVKLNDYGWEETIKVLYIG